MMVSEEKFHNYDNTVANKFQRDTLNHNRPSTEWTCLDYTVGWICGLPKEQIAATAMLDNIHPDLPKSLQDHNSYILGSIGEHKIVITCLPNGDICPNLAASVVTDMARSFPSIKIGLMVGIGGGIPSKVKLGDVVISSPVGQYQGVVQWDFGKGEDDQFERAGRLNNPPNALLTAVSKMETWSRLRGSMIPCYLEEMETKWPALNPQYTRPPSPEAPSECSDVLSMLVPPGNETESQVAKPDTPEPKDICVHSGLIVSGGNGIMSAKLRDAIDQRLGGNVLCIETKAAGLMNHFPCVVIQGICNYADSDQILEWQEYAATTAAACAKELLGYVQPNHVDRVCPVKSILAAGKLPWECDSYTHWLF